MVRTLPQKVIWDLAKKTAEQEPPKTGTKRKRSESKKKTPAKKPKQSKKRTQKGGFLWSNIPGTTKGSGKTQKGGLGYSAPIRAKMLKGKGKQTGGVQPPIHYPLGNYPRGMKWGRGKSKRSKSKTIRRKQSGGMPIWLRLIMGRGKGKKRTGKKRTVTKASLDDIFS